MPPPIHHDASSPTPPAKGPELDALGLFHQDLVGMVRLDVAGRIVATNGAFTRMLELPPDWVLGHILEDLVHAEDGEALADATRRADGVPLRLRFRAGEDWAEVRCAFTALEDHDGGAHLVGLLTEGQSLEEEEDQASRQARFDPLTGMGNRLLLLEQLEDRLASGDSRLAVVALNLDRFKAINDSLGQASGDEVLVEIARRLQSFLQPGDSASRIAGDDFVLLWCDVATKVHANARVIRMLQAITEPVQLEGLNIQVTASAGVTLVDPAEGLSADQAMTQAGAALQAAKGGGRARHVLYDHDVGVVARDRLRIETGLRDALENGDLVVAYQPIRDLAAGTLAGAEALARWFDPQLGSVAPERFMEVAHDSGLVEPLTRFVLDRAIADASEWRRSTGVDAHVAINLSAQDLARRDLANEVAGVLSRHGLPPRALRLEIVETILVEAGQRVRDNLRELRELGVRLGIDDFGTGYSTMTYLKHLPVDFVKIDKSFVTGLGTSREDTAIVRSVILLAKSLDLTVVAEGIETPTQMRLLLELGCDMGQGFLIGHAEPPDVLAASLTAERDSD